ncbi:protein NipSnap homolog 3B-like isoform X2 [Dreissena polymorpha]|uniref:NIPSNAP domain-containing protein n=1 Tax=Dreissena polymorpha TaxID=45954 RepID=A0A9D4RB18_DREPO|nr:protein NipSnap homolog 3B-like isoform X2 [Dreissena polymorpha]KAH3861644.1 hypothetical protein DPMN_024578 [Dreissena polymorpha]
MFTKVRVRDLALLLRHPRVQNCFVTTRCHASTQTSKIYEIRHYRMHVHTVKTFLEMAKQSMPVRTSYSKMVGFWTTELGDGINDIVHIWEYGSLDERRRVRQALATDRRWQDDFIAHIMPMCLMQRNNVLQCMPGTDIVYPKPDSGSYELQEVKYNQNLAKAADCVKGISRPGSQLLACWSNVLSRQNHGLLLWHHKELDNILETQSPVKEIEIKKRKLLTPQSFSVMR